MLESYFPVLVFILFAAAFGFIPIVAGWVIGPSKPDAEKLSPFECGFEPFEDARIKFFLARGIGADGVHVGPGAEPFEFDERFSRRGRGHDNVAVPDAFFHAGTQVDL